MPDHVERDEEHEAAQDQVLAGGDAAEKSERRGVKAIYAANVKALDEGGEEGTFEAVVSVFGNVDRVGDKMVKGAFSKSLVAWREKATQGKFIPVYYSHNYTDPRMLVGKVLDAEERDEGLWVKGQLFLRKEAGQDVYEAFKEGVLDQFSFAYDVVREKQRNGANEVLEVELHEVGPTPMAVNDETYLVGVKNTGGGGGSFGSVTIDVLPNIVDAKAGRVLSSKNEADLNQAVSLISNVLKQLEKTDEEKATEPDVKAEEPETVKAEEPTDDLVAALFAAQLRQSQNQ